MQKYTNSVQNLAGDAIKGATVTVTTLSGAAVTTYSDEGITPLTSISSDDHGLFSFYVANGAYNIAVSGTGISPYHINDCTIFDPKDALFSLVETVDGVRDLNKQLVSYVTTKGYWAKGDGGEGDYWYDSTDTTSADDGGSIIVATDNGRWKLMVYGLLNVRQFGAKGDINTDDTASIQAACNVAETTVRKVFIPRGKYLITQIVIPTGVEFYGSGSGGYGSVTTEYPYDTSTLMQKYGFSDDAIIFRGPLQSSFYRLFFVNLHDFCLLKNCNPADTIGNGISFRQEGQDRTLDSSHCLVNGICEINRVLVRAFPENGIYSRQGCAPAYFHNLDFIFNGGYGIRFDGLNYSRGVVLTNIAGDGNKGGAVIYLKNRYTDNIVSIDGLFAEERVDNPYGFSTGPGGGHSAQPHAIEIGEFGDNSFVNIKNVICSGPNTFSPHSAIYLSYTVVAPAIFFDGVVIGYTGKSGSPYTLYDNHLGTNINKSTASGSYNAPGLAYSGITLFGDSGFVQAPFVGDCGIEAKGTAPGVFLYETDAPEDQKFWSMGPSAGVLYFRTIADNSSASSIFLNVNRTGTTPTSVQFPIKMRYTGAPAYDSDGAAGTGGLGAGDIYRTTAGELRIKL
jgi:hypothetical protein